MGQTTQLASKDLLNALTGGDGAAGTWGTNVKSLELEKYALSVNVKSLELENDIDGYDDGRGLKLPVSGNTGEDKMTSW